MKKLFAVALLAIPMIAAPIVTYSTTGTFSGGSTPGTSTYTTSNGTLSFLMGSGSYDLGAINPTNITLGTIDSNGFIGTPEAIGGTFTLTVNQTAPFAGTASTSGTLSGSIVVDASSVRLLFSPASVTLGAPGTMQTTYSVVQSPIGIAIVPPSSVPGGANAGSTTIQGQLSLSGVQTTPEPATLGLMGLGLAAVGLIARRRRA